MNRSGVGAKIADMAEMKSPNILFVTTDQQRTDSLGCYGSGWMSTPYLDGLAAAGVRFDSAFCTSPLCTPSRVSLFTGQYPSRHGAWNVGCNARDDGAFISHALADAGYRTHHIGKAHWHANGASAEASVESLTDNPRFPSWHGPYFGFQTVELSIGHNGYNLRAGHYAESIREENGGATDFSWHSRAARPFGGEAVDWALPPAFHSSVWIADRGCEFLQSHCTTAPDQPFFLHLGFQDPHHPHAVPLDLPDSARVDPATVPLPRYVSGELDSRPGHYRAAYEGRLESHPTRGDYAMAGQGGGFDFRDLPERDVREARAYYYTLCQLIDTQVGRVLSLLDCLGAAEDTLVVFTSDHGELLGDHGLWQKGFFPYDELLRVPLLARWPRRLGAGRIVPEIFSLADLAPTFLAAAGIDPIGGPHLRDGVNWLQFLTAAASAPRDHAIVEHIDDPKKLGFRTLLTRDVKLTAWRGADLECELTHRDEVPMGDPGDLIATNLNNRLASLTPAEPLLLPRLAYS